MPHSCSCQWVTLCDKLAKTKLWEHWHCPPLAYEPWMSPCITSAADMAPETSNRAPCTENPEQRPTPAAHAGQLETRPLLPTWVSWGPTPCCPTWVSQRPTHCCLRGSAGDLPPAAHVGQLCCFIESASVSPSLKQKHKNTNPSI